MESGDGFTIVSADELERSGRWSLVRRGLGVRSFGINVVEMEPGYKLPEHHELDRDQEEVMFVLEGDTTLVVDGREYPFPAGSFVRVDPPLQRTIVNTGSQPARILLASAPTTSGYAPMDWA